MTVSPGRAAGVTGPGEPAHAAAVFDFSGSTVVVTGAGSGIGRRIAARFLASGAAVFAADRDLTGVPPGVVPVATDVSDESSVQRLVAAAMAATGRIDVLCNNAAINSFTDVVGATGEEFDRIMAVNARGVFLGMTHAIPHMLAAGYGAIVNVASVAALIGIPDRASYSASKGAVVALTRQAAVQYAARGIRCNCVCPGTVDSPMVASVLAASADPAATRMAMERRQPIGRMASPDEIASVALFLASDAASYVTGVALAVDGGWSEA